MAKLRIESRYGIVPNNVLNDKNLSWKAKGLFAYIQSKPDNWDFAVNRITRDSKDGKDGTASGILELEKVGYLARKKFKNDKWQWDIEYTLYDQPIPENPERETIPENPATENPVTENPETNKNINTNKEIVKKNNNIKGKKEFDKNSFEYRISYKFLKAHKKNWTPGVIYKLNNNSEEDVLKGFAGGVDKLQRLDKYKEKEIEFIIDYLIGDNKIDKPGKKFYWLDQIQTIDKLRAKNREKIPYFVVLIDPAKQNFINNKRPWTFEV